MPGFMINGLGGKLGAAPFNDVLRDHRFKITTFMGIRADETPFIQVKDIDLPEKIIEVLEIKCPGTTYKFAKSVNYGDLKVVLYGTIELVEKLKTLEDKIHTVDDGIGDFNKYLDDVIIEMYDGQESTQVTFTCKGCFVHNVSWGNLSYGSSELKLVTVILKCNFYKVS